MVKIKEVAIVNNNQSINIRFNITKQTTADTATTEVIKTRKRSLLSRTKV